MDLPPIEHFQNPFHPRLDPQNHSLWKLLRTHFSSDRWMCASGDLMLPPNAFNQSVNKEMYRNISGLPHQLDIGNYIRTSAYSLWRFLPGCNSQKDFQALFSDPYDFLVRGGIEVTHFGVGIDSDPAEHPNALPQHTHRAIWWRWIDSQNPSETPFDVIRNTTRQAMLENKPMKPRTWQSSARDWYKRVLEDFNRMRFMSNRKAAVPVSDVKPSMLPMSMGLLKDLVLSCMLTHEQEKLIQVLTKVVRGGDDPEAFEMTNFKLYEVELDRYFEHLKELQLVRESLPHNRQHHRLGIAAYVDEDGHFMTSQLEDQLEQCEEHCPNLFRLLEHLSMSPTKRRQLKVLRSNKDMLSSGEAQAMYKPFRWKGEKKGGAQDSASNLEELIQLERVKTYENKLCALNSLSLVMATRGRAALVERHVERFVLCRVMGMRQEGLSMLSAMGVCISKSSADQLFRGNKSLGDRIVSEITRRRSANRGAPITANISNNNTNAGHPSAITKYPPNAMNPSSMYLSLGMHAWESLPEVQPTTIHQQFPPLDGQHTATCRVPGCQVPVTNDALTMQSGLCEHHFLVTPDEDTAGMASIHDNMLGKKRKL